MGFFELRFGLRLGFRIRVGVRVRVGVGVKFIVSVSVSVSDNVRLRLRLGLGLGISFLNILKARFSAYIAQKYGTKKAFFGLKPSVNTFGKI